MTLVSAMKGELGRPSLQVGREFMNSKIEGTIERGVGIEEMASESKPESH